MSDAEPSGGVQKMRANRRIVETACVSCRRGFQFGEEVVACSVCGGYQHAACWETSRACPHRAGQEDAGAPAGVRGMEAPASDAAPVILAAAPPPPIPVPEAVPPPPAWTDESLVESLRRENQGKPTEELLAAYKKRSTWLSAEFFEAVRRILVERGVDDPSLKVAASRSQEGTVAPVAPAQAATRPEPGPGEKYCTQCAEIIKSEAVKCRFCGAALDQRLSGAEVPSHIMSEISKNASQALTYGILGLCICAPIFGSMAISRGNAALRDLDQYPLYQGPRGKAKAGVVLGWVDWCLFVLVVIGRVASVSNPGRF